MPTEFVAQNGVVIKQSTKIAVTGCTASKAKPKPKPKLKKENKTKRTGNNRGAKS